MTNEWKLIGEISDYITHICFVIFFMWAFLWFMDVPFNLLSISIAFFVVTVQRIFVKPESLFGIIAKWCNKKEQNPLNKNPLDD